MRCLCPFCLGELPGNPGGCVKCRHCGSDIHWGAGQPFKSEFEARNAERVQGPRVAPPKSFQSNPKPVLSVTKQVEGDSQEAIDARIKHFLQEQKSLEEDGRLGFLDRCLLLVVKLFSRRDTAATVERFLWLRRTIYFTWQRIKRVPTQVVWLIFVVLAIIFVFFAGLVTPRVVQPHAAVAFNKLAALTDQAAKEIAALGGEKLDLSGLKSLEATAAKELAKWRGKDLDLSGLKLINANVAKELAAWSGESLNLSGLQELPQAVALALANWQGDLLRLNGVKSLDDDVAGALKDFQGKSVELLGLVAVGESTFAILKVNPRIALAESAAPPPLPAVTPSQPADMGLALKDASAEQNSGSELPEMTNSIGIRMKMIPAGTFTMGEDRGNHEVTLTQPFYLGVTEVTNAQWQAIMGAVPSACKDADHPVEQVSWEGAVSFCEKLSAIPNEQAAGRVYRLPTEAEWEYACRAGTTTTYSFGDDESLLGDFGWFKSNANGQTLPVGQKRPNAWGLYDMHGNVFEWCSDWYGDYSGRAATDPRGPSTGSSRVFRGGGQSSTAWPCRSARRYWFDPSYHDDNLGFRLALSLPGTTPPTASVKTPAPPPPVPKPATATPTNESMTSVAKTSPSTPSSKQAINEPEPFPSELPRTITNSLGIRMNLIPAGKFTMGEGNDAHEVTLTKPFYLGMTEVTNAQGKRLMGFTPSIHKKDDQPIEMVRWGEAVKFCEILSARPAEKAAGRVYRLPTEAEWEFACRAGTTTAYSFGDDELLLGDFGWFKDNANKHSHPVGQKQPNAWGLFDMYGNVSELCSVYAGGAVTDPQGPSEGSDRVFFRGGGWFSVAEDCRSANRSRTSMSSRAPNRGFRLALSPSGGKPPEAGK